MTSVADAGEWTADEPWEEYEQSWSDPDEPVPAGLFDAESAAATRPFDYDAPAPVARAA
jgi:hypothetical protein